MEGRLWSDGVMVVVVVTATVSHIHMQIGFNHGHRRVFGGEGDGNGEGRKSGKRRRRRRKEKKAFTVSLLESIRAKKQLYLFINYKCGYHISVRTTAAACSNPFSSGLISAAVAVAAAAVAIHY